MNIIIKRDWNNREITTDISVDKKGIEIVMSLDDFVDHVVVEVAARLKVPTAEQATIWKKFSGLFGVAVAIEDGNLIENAIRAAAKATIEAAKKNTEQVM